MYVASKHGHDLFKIERLDKGDGEEKEATKVCYFENEIQNLCLVEGFIYNFSSDQFGTSSSVERFNVNSSNSQDAEILFDQECEFEFSPYSPLGCFGMAFY